MVEEGIAVESQRELQGAAGAHVVVQAREGLVRLVRLCEGLGKLQVAGGAVRVHVIEVEGVHEGAGALVLEEYEHAKARGAKIYGEVCGYGSTCDAYHITAPHPEAEGGARAMVQALTEAGYREGQRVYVNAHGTGTPLNDAGETLAIKKALGEDAAYKALVSSTKSMTGHMLGAAGAVEAIVCLKVLETGVVPPTINLLEKDPKCDLNYVPNQAAQADIDLCLSNSLGFGGHNACLAFRKV